MQRLLCIPLNLLRQAVYKDRLQLGLIRDSMGSMNTLTLALPCTLPLLMAACTVDTGGHARIHRRADPTPVAAMPAYIPMSQEAPAPSPEHEGCIPCDHGAFTCLPSYPRTFRVWKDEAKMQAEGPRHVEIDLARQRGIFVVNDEVVMDFPVCTGKERKPTPTGKFRITQKNVHHHSNIYDVPMPYFMRLTNGGIGMHVGDVFRAPASHGCIRLTREACIPLFRNAPSGTKVLIRSHGWSTEHEPAAPIQEPQLANAAG